MKILCVYEVMKNEKDPKNVWKQHFNFLKTKIKYTSKKITEGKKQLIFNNGYLWVMVHVIDNL